MKALNTYITEKLVLNKDTFKGPKMPDPDEDFEVMDYNKYNKNFKNFKGMVYASVYKIIQILGDVTVKRGPVNSGYTNAYIWCMKYKDIIFIIQSQPLSRPKGDYDIASFKIWTETQKDTLDIIDVLKKKGLSAELYY